MHPEIIRTDNLVNEALALVERSADVALFERGVFRIGLSGGNTPRPVYEALAMRKDAWAGWEFSFGDERCVPPGDERSNFGMVRKALFDKVPVPPGQILRMRGEAVPEEAAQEYEAALRERAEPCGFYRHDVLLLGMGEDGHTASLFPGSDALDVTDKWVTANRVAKLDTVRLTLTYTILNAARHVCFLVNSRGKEAVLERALAGNTALPSARVRPTNGNLTWIIGN